MSVRTHVRPTALHTRERGESYETLTSLLHGLVSGLALVFTSPIFLVIAVAIKLTSRGPVFYRGARIGRNGKVFTIYKFRTLAEGAERRIGARLLSPGDRTVYATRLGRFLKRSKLDELPQLVNVLRGEMRLVGPRPVRPVFLDQIRREIPGFEVSFSVPPGMTGIAQLRGGYYTSLRDKLRYNLHYLENRSPLLDLKLVLLTAVKILDRWLKMGLLALFLFLFVSFVPPDLQDSLHLRFGETRINLIYAFILVGAAFPLLTKDLSHFRLYRCPLNAAIVSLLLLGLVSAAFAVEPYLALQGTGYYVVTGLLVSFMIVNSLGGEQFSTFTVRMIALTSVAMSLIGLAQILIVNGGAAIASDAETPHILRMGYDRMSSLLGNPMRLAVYLVLGIPLLFAEVSRARTQRQRDFWIVCATISVVGIVFTQTRVGLAALLVTGVVFLSRRPGHAVRFLAVFALCFWILASLGVPRFSPVRIAHEAGEWLLEQAPVLEQSSMREWITGAGARTEWWFSVEEAIESSDTRTPDSLSNMYITLAWEQGIGAWLVLLWLIASVLRILKRAHDRSNDPHRKTLLWAILSCIVGFLVSMNGMNAFHHLPIQIFFWSLVGIGLSLANGAGGRPRNMIWRFGDAGDG